MRLAHAIQVGCLRDHADERTASLGRQYETDR